jgi:putative FmdB family regulatory protein
VPTYSYRCTECGTAFDIHQAFTEDSLTVCPTCNGVLRKVFSPIGVTFTGSGFYSNDSRSAKSGAPKSSSAPAEKSSDSSSSTPAPAAPAAKPAPAAPSAS